jgi:hypothetical protein
MTTLHSAAAMNNYRRGLPQQQQQQSSMQQQHSRLKMKQVLPCFNLVCTGTCAYGPKCTFLHDPRAQLPRHLRKQAEFMLQSHLHTYRPNVNKTATAAATASALRVKAYPLHASCGLCSDDEVDEVLEDCTDSDGTHSSHEKSLTFRRDDIFDYPTIPMSYQEPNAKLYEPTDEQIPGHGRELSMWHHMLACANEKNIPLALEQEALSGNRRLPVFQLLGQGRSLSKTGYATCPPRR